MMAAQHSDTLALRKTEEEACTPVGNVVDRLLVAVQEVNTVDNVALQQLEEASTLLEEVASLTLPPEVATLPSTRQEPA